MARIPEAELERLKSEISVERLVEAAGVALKRAGKDLLGRCPFHDDREASLVVTPGKNLWHCFGCQTGGGPIDWVMRSQGVSFRHAVEILRERQPLVAKVVKQSTVPKLPAPVAFDADERELLHQVIGYYQDTLKTSSEALAYLERRGIRSAEAIERFRLGFANRTLGLRLPESNRKNGGAIRERLQRLGILRESGHEHFNGSIVIPVIDAAGNRLPPVSARPASGGVERRGARRKQGDHPLRGAHRCAHLLVRGLPQRHRRLRGRGLHRRSLGGLQEVRHRAGAHRL
jgi:DNA primase catalytic core